MSQIVPSSRKASQLNVEARTSNAKVNTVKMIAIPSSPSVHPMVTRRMRIRSSNVDVQVGSIPSSPSVHSMVTRTRGGLVVGGGDVDVRKSGKQSLTQWYRSKVHVKRIGFVPKEYNTLTNHLVLNVTWHPKGSPCSLKSRRRRRRRSRKEYLIVIQIVICTTKVRKKENCFKRNHPSATYGCCTNCIFKPIH